MGTPTSLADWHVWIAVSGARRSVSLLGCPRRAVRADHDSYRRTPIISSPASADLLLAACSARERRHANTTACERQAVLVSTVEHLVAEHYRTIDLSPEASDALTGMIEDIFDRIDAESEAQRRDLTRQKERLEDEQLRLLQAHYADAISLPVLKKEQHRIEGMLADIDQRLNAYRAGREDAKLRRRAYLHLATNAHAFYLACDEGRRRLCNQAFFTKITLTEHLDMTSEFTGVYETILDPTNRLHAEFWQRTGQLHPDIDLNNEATLPTDHGDRVGTSTKWWS